MQAYTKLEALFRKRYNYAHFISLADWDMNVCMPEKGGEARGEAIATLMNVAHEMITASTTADLIKEANRNVGELNETQRANLREMTVEWEQETALPADFVERKARLTTKAHNVWKQSRTENNFALFLPVLKELVAVAREEGGYLSANTSRTPYEALMSLYEPGLTTARLDEIFNDVKSWLPSLLKEVLAKQREMKENIVPLQPPFPTVKQEALCKEMMRTWQFDFDAGRLDISPHAFTGMTKEDCRITTNYDENVLVQSLYGTIHETGHAKYEQNCGPREMLGQPVCMARSLGVHESQSLFAEFQIGHADPFVEYLTPKLKEYFGDQPGFEVENVKKILKRVEPGYIRVDADEVCYPLHVILRYEIERDLMEGKLEAEDVPRVWNEKMKEYLGLETEGKDNLGCLQDIHWSQGSLGYFPTYSLGAMYAAQLMATIKKELGADTVDKCLRTGDFAPLFAKQKEKIWDKGRLYDTDDLITQATGERLNPKYFREHLEHRYLGKY